MTKPTLRQVATAAVTWVTFNLMIMLQVYLKESAEIDKTIRLTPNSKSSLSTDFSFVQVLESASYPHGRAILTTFLVIFLPALITLVLWKVCVTEEKHQGWKRTAQSVPILATLLTAAIFYGYPFFMVLAFSAVAFAMSLIVIRTTKWIYLGFVGEKIG